MTATIESSEAPPTPLQLYEQAHATSPSNVVIALRLGNVLESQGDFPAALAVYVPLAERWPRVFELRYRIAACFAMSEASLVQFARSADEWNEPTAKAKERRRAKAASTTADPATTKGAQDLHAELLGIAEREWVRCEAFLGRNTSALRYARTFIRRGDRDRAYQRNLVRYRKQLLAGVRLAHLATTVQQTCPFPRALPTVRSTAAPGTALAETAAHRASVLKRLDDKSADVTAWYNAACCYSRLYEITGERDGVDDVERAIAQLKKAVDADQPQRWISAIADDADLAPLRQTSQFRAWWSRLHPGTEAESPMSWAIGLATQMSRRWALDAALWPANGKPAAVRMGPTLTDLLVRDQQLRATLHQWVVTGEWTTDAVVESIPRFHIRVPEPPKFERRRRRIDEDRLFNIERAKSAADAAQIWSEMLGPLHIVDLDF